MKVSALVKKLLEMPQDLDVVTEGCDCFETDIDVVVCENTPSDQVWIIRTDPTMTAELQRPKIKFRAL